MKQDRRRGGSGAFDLREAFQVPLAKIQLEAVDQVVEQAFIFPGSRRTRRLQGTIASVHMQSDIVQEQQRGTQEKQYDASLSDRFKVWLKIV